MPADPTLTAALAALDAAREAVVAVMEAPAPEAQSGARLPLLVRVSQIGPACGQSRTWGFERVKAGDIPAVDVPGTGRCVRRSDLEAFVSELPRAT
jgi:hypothetical protein